MTARLGRVGRLLSDDRGQSHDLTVDLSRDLVRSDKRQREGRGREQVKPMIDGDKMISLPEKAVAEGGR